MSADEPPLLRILTPDATAEEIAAILAVLGATRAAPAEPERPRRVWAARDRSVRGEHLHGAGRWRSSARGQR